MKGKATDAQEDVNMAKENTKANAKMAKEKTKEAVGLNESHM